MNTKIKKAIQEWIDIQNITIDKEFYKPYLERIESGEIDVCSGLQLETCTYQVGCSIYKNQCVDKVRLKPMHYTGNILLSTKYKIPFEIVESKYITTLFLLIHKFAIYYVIVRSLVSGNIYVLFSSGIVLKKRDLYENNELMDGIMLLIMRILELSRDSDIYICGHSMGSVLSMYTGYLMSNHSNLTRDVFVNRCNVLGSASAKWMSTDTIWNREKQPNIYQFISCELRINKTRKRLLVDCYQLDGETEYMIYPYFYYVFLENDKLKMIESDSDELANYVIEYTEKNSSQCQKLHRWAYYMGLLQHNNDGILVSNSKLNSRIVRSKTYNVYRSKKQNKKRNNTSKNMRE